MDEDSNEQSRKSVSVPWVASAPARGERLVMMTAYDFSQARLVEQAGADIVLVGDSLGMVVLGHTDTLSVTMDEMLHHVKAVRRGVEKSLLVADMPYGSFHLGRQQTVAEAVRFIKEAGAQAEIQTGLVDRDGGMVGRSITRTCFGNHLPFSIHPARWP